MEVMARYGDAADVAWKVGRIMLKYRPIAPKPVTSGAVTAAPVDAKSGGGRGKRKGAGSREGRRGRKNARKSTATSYVVEAGAFREDKEKYNNNNNNNNNNNFLSHPVVTLPLIPVTPERKEEVSSPAATPSPTASDGHVTVSFFGRTATWRQQQQRQTNNNSNNSSGGSSSSSGSGSSSLVVAPRPVRPVGSWVTVECVTDAWRKGDVALALSSPAGLEKDTCPGFISDSNDRVMWTNAAYRRMVVGSADEEGEEVGAGDQGVKEEVMRVALVTRGMVPVAEEGVTCFTCRVRVRYACRGKGKVSMAAPCDVWRLADGRLAWRLDVKAALSLSLGS